MGSGEKGGWSRRWGSGEVFSAKLGSLDYPPKKKESLEVFKQGTGLCSTVEAGHSVQPGLGEGRSGGRAAADMVWEKAWPGLGRGRRGGEVKDTEGERQHFPVGPWERWGRGSSLGPAPGLRVPGRMMVPDARDGGGGVGGMGKKWVCSELREHRGPLE